MRYRIEKDALGEKVIPQESYFGIGTLRAKDAFEITKHGLSRQNIKALAVIKKVAAKTNYEFGLLDLRVSEAISLSADEILNGRLHGQFVTDSVQDGYGIGMNINACEVIANRANEMLGGEKGTYEYVSVQDVNMFQDIREVVVLSGKLTAIKLAKKMFVECKKFKASIDALLESSCLSEDDELYDEIKSIGAIFERDAKRFDKAMNGLLEICYGANVSLNSKQEKEDYINCFLKNLNQQATEKYKLSENRFVVSRNLDGFMHLSTAAKNLMINLSKCISDLKYLAKMGKVKIPNIYETNIPSEDYIFDFAKQISFYIVGNDLTISRSVEAGTLEENPYMPIICASLYESLNLIRRTIRTVREIVIEVMEIKNEA